MVTKSYILIWSADAVWRLNNIYNWYAEYESIKRAKKVISSIKSVARNITKGPYKHTECFEVENPTPFIRKALVAKTYWIVYEVEEKRIVILDIIHGAMNPENIKNIF